MILNASGCLDALTAPDVAQSLDAFVTKTVTFLARQGVQLRIAETDLGMLTRSGSPIPGSTASSRTPPPIGRARDPHLGLCRRVFRPGLRRPVCTSRRAQRSRGRRTQRLVPERCLAGRRGGGDRGRRARSDHEDALRQARPGPRCRDRRGGRGARRCGRAHAREHDSRARSTSGRSSRSSVRGRRSRPRRSPDRPAAVFTAYRATGLPIVGVGGVETGTHGLELIAAGATAFALGTVLFADPEAPLRVREELEREASARGCNRLPPTLRPTRDRRRRLFGASPERATVRCQRSKNA